MDARSEMRPSQTNIFYQTNMQLFLTREPKRISVEHKTVCAPGRKTNGEANVKKQEKSETPEEKK